MVNGVSSVKTAKFAAQRPAKYFRSHRDWPRGICVFGAILALAVSTAISGTPAGAPPEKKAFPLRRILIAATDVPALLTKLKNGVLQELPLKEFEAKLRRAENQFIGDNRSSGPRLLKARYRARLSGRALTGAGDWLIHQDDDSAQLFGVGNLNLALADVTVNEKPGEKKTAVIGVFNGKKTAVLLRKKGEQSLFFDWSLGGKSASGELHFQFRVPSCALNSLELTLPNVYGVSVTTPGAQLTGPRESGENGQNLWSISFSGKSVLNFALHQLRGKGAQRPLLLTTVQTEQNISAGLVDCTHTFHLQVWHNAVTELEFDWDPSLELVDVECPGVEMSEVSFRPAAGKAGAAQTADAPSKILTIRFPQPIRGRLPPLQIRGRAVFPHIGRWSSPDIRLRNASRLKENLAIRLDPAVEMRSWNPGSFQAASAKDDSSYPSFALTRAGDANRLRPNAILRVPDATLFVDQQTLWEIGRDNAALHSLVKIRPNRGGLHLFQFQLPKDWKKGWQIEEIHTEPKGLLRRWTPLQAKRRWSLLVEFTRGIKPEETVKLHLLLRAPPYPAAVRKTRVLAFPEFFPSFSGAFRGAYSIAVGPEYTPQVLTVSAAPTPPPLAGPWVKKSPLFHYEIRDARLTGRLRITPKPHDFRAAYVAQIRFADNHGIFRSTMNLQPRTGGLKSVDFHISAPLIGRPQVFPVESSTGPVVVERHRYKEMLPQMLGFGASNAVAGAAIQNALPIGEWWRLVFAEPMHSTVSLNLVADVMSFSHLSGKKGSPGTPQLPLLQFDGAKEVHGRVIFPFASQQPAKLSSDGIVFAGEGNEPLPALGSRFSPSAVVSSAFESKSFRNVLGRFPRLWLPSGLRRLPPAPIDVRCEFAHLTGVIRSGQPPLYRFRFELEGWRKTTLPVELPDGCRLLFASVQGQRVDRVARSFVGGHNKIGLPAPSGPGKQVFEIVYELVESPAGQPWFFSVKPLAPSLPFSPKVLRQTLLLAPEVTPVHLGGWRQVTRVQKTFSSNFVGLLERCWRAGRPAPVFPRGDAQMPNGSDLVSSFRKTAKKITGRPQDVPLTLAAALRGIVLAKPPLTSRLVIDAAALALEGLSSDTPVPNGNNPGEFLNSLGLALLPVDDALLLTTHRKENLIKEERIPLSDFQSVREAVDQALIFGRDGSGEYQSVLEWGFSKWRHSDSGFTGISAGLSPGIGEPGWSVWEAPAESAMPPGLVLADVNFTRAAAALLTILLTLVFWRCGRRLSPRWRLRYFFGALIGGFLLLLWVPPPIRILVEWPLIAIVAAFVVMTMFGNGRAKPVEIQNRRVLRRAAAALLGIAFAVCLLLPLLSKAQDKQPFTVYLLGSPSSPDVKVLVPPSLLEKLESADGRFQTKLPPAAIVSGKYYDGKIREGLVEFKADLKLFCFSNRAKVLLPFKGVLLQPGATLAGALAYPVPNPGPESGYFLLVQGHKNQFVRLQLSFCVPFKEIDGVYAIDFEAPRTPQSLIELSLPAKSNVIGARTAQGMQLVKNKGNSVLLRANLGMVPGESPGNRVWISWRSPTKPAANSSAEVTELHYWDLKKSPAQLKSTLIFRGKRGPLSTLAIRIPPGTFLKSVEALQSATQNGVQTPGRIESWRLIRQGSFEVLQVKLETPTSKEVALSLEFLCSTDLQKQQTDLMLPAPLRASFREGMFACNIDAANAQLQGLQLRLGRPVLGEFRDVWKKLYGKPLTSVKHARRFLRSPSARFAGVRLKNSSLMPAARQEIEWMIHPNFAELKARLHLRSNGRDVTFFQWEVPSEITIVEVAAENLLQWNVSAQAGKKRVQIWLSKSPQEANVDITGWLPAAVMGKAKSQWKPPAAKKNGSFVLPRLGFVSPLQYSTRIQLKAAPGIALIPKSQKRLQLVSRKPTIVYSTNSRNHSAQIAARRAPVLPDVKGIIFAHKKNNEVLLEGNVEYRHPLEGLQAVTLELHDWHGAKPELSAPPGSKVKGNQLPTGYRWRVMLPAKTSRVCMLSWKGRYEARADKAFVLPAMQTGPARSKDFYFAFSAQEFRAGGVSDIMPLSQIADLFPWAPQANERDREWKVCQVRPGSLKCTITPLPPDRKNVVRILSGEQHAVLNGGSWLHEGRYRLIVKRRADLKIALPAGAELHSVRLNGSVANVARFDQQSLQLAVGEKQSLQYLHLSWAFPEGSETPELPATTSPHFDSVESFPLQRSLRIPLGFESLSGKSDTAVVSAGRLMFSSDSSDARIPVMRLQSSDVSATRQRIWISVIVASLTAFALMLSFVPVAVWLFRWTWPEQLLAVVVVGWLAFGVGLLGVGLAAFAVAARTGWLILGAYRLIRRAVWR